MTPITIIGGGLAGLAMGIGLRQKGVPVTLYDSGFYPRHRVCGEFMTGLSPSLLEQLGINDCFKDALTHKTCKWFHQGHPVRKYKLPDPAVGISRYSLDNRMVERLRSLGGNVREGMRIAESNEPGRILTTGRQPRQGGSIGIKGHWEGLQTTADLELHMGNHAYVGVSGVEDGYVNVCGLFRKVARGRFKSPLDRFHATLEQHGLACLSDRLIGARLREGSLCSVTGLSYSSTSMTMQGCLGDRHRQIPPFTGHGMTIALESAAAVLPILTSYCSGGCNWSEYLDRSEYTLSRRFGKRYRIAGFLHPAILNPRLQSLLVAFSRIRLLPFGTLYRLTH